MRPIAVIGDRAACYLRSWPTNGRINAIPDAMAQVLASICVAAMGCASSRSGRSSRSTRSDTRSLLSTAGHAGDVRRPFSMAELCSWTTMLAWEARWRACEACGRKWRHGDCHDHPHREPRGAANCATRGDAQRAKGATCERISTSSGDTSSDMESTASRKSKPSSYVVSHPLPPSRISWLRRQSKHVGEVSSRRLKPSAKSSGATHRRPACGGR